MQALIQTSGRSPAFGPPGEAGAAALLPLAGAPVAAATIGWLERQGAATIHLLLRERPWMLSQHLEAHPPTRAAIAHVLVRQPGTDAQRARRALAGAEGPIVVARGTLVTDIELAPCLARHAESGARLTVLLVPRQAAPSGPAFDLDAAGFLVPCAAEGPYASAGIVLAAPGILARGDEPGDGDWLDASLVAGALAAGEQVRALLTPGFWSDAASPTGYARAMEAVLAGQVAGVSPLADERAPGIWVAPTARLDPGARLLPPCHIGADARVGPEAEIGPCTSIEAGAEVRRGAQLQACCVLPGTRLGVGSRWRDRLLYPNGSLAWRTTGATPEPSDDPERLGDTYRPALSERLHTGLDQALAALALLALGPLLAAIALAIRLDSPGPALFIQLRAGRDPKPSRSGLPRAGVFPCFKFRTMHIDAERRVAELRSRNQYAQGAFFKLTDDPRVTRLGAWLRRTSLDELPQLFNVLRGEMRLVGNRPLPLYEAEALTEDWQRQRFLAPAGITGLWQISGRSELSERERLALDALYAISRSFWGDLGILIRTVPALLARRGAR